MAENNSSAPIKTAEGAVQLWCVHVTGADDVHPMPSREVALEEANGLNISFCRINRQDVDPVLIAVVAEWPHSADSHAAGLMIRNECLRMRGDQAVSAQAPAAVTIQDAVTLLGNEAARLERLYGRKGWYGFGDEKAAHIEHLRVADALAATPALPATADSSAGDLSAPTDAEIIALNDGERFFSMSESRFGKEVNPHTQYHTGEPGYLQFARAVLARWGAAPQAQPADALTATPPKSNTLWRLLTNGYDWDYVSGGHMSERDRSALETRANSIWAAICTEASPKGVLAQPADALDAARYRWLRDISVPPHNFYLSVPDEFKDERFTPVQVDAAIDAARAAMAAAQEGGNAATGKDGAA